MLIFNNRRMLHGRKSYNPQLTERHLEGCYLDEDEFLSRLTLLRLAKDSQSAPSDNHRCESQPISTDSIMWTRLPSGAVVPAWSVVSQSVVTRTHPASTRVLPEVQT